MTTRDWTRRDFLARASAATLSALAAGRPRAVRAQDHERITATADAVIVLVDGGRDGAHRDVRPEALHAVRARAEARAGAEHVSGDRHGGRSASRCRRGSRRIASVMDRATLIRSYTAGDLGFILHSRHQYQWHTGYAPPQTVAAPHLGAIVARTLGPQESGRAGLHQHRPAARRRRRRGAEGVHHRGVSRQRVRPVQRAVPG